MNVKERIDADVIAAMKAHDATRVDVLRFTKSSLLSAEKTKREPLTDAEVEKVLASEVKRRLEAAEQFRAANRVDLAEPEEKAAAVLQTYLPQPLTPAEVQAIVDECISALGAKGNPQAFGKVMGAVMAKVGTRADGKTIQTAVRSLLNPST